jgi:hypothetical protein
MRYLEEGRMLRKEGRKEGYEGRVLRKKERV